MTYYSFCRKYNLINICQNGWIKIVLFSQQNMSSHNFNFKISFPFKVRKHSSGSQKKMLHIHEQNLKKPCETGISPHPQRNCTSVSSVNPETKSPFIWNTVTPPLLGHRGFQRSQVESQMSQVKEIFLCKRPIPPFTWDPLLNLRNRGSQDVPTRDQFRGGGSRYPRPQWTGLRKFRTMVQLECCSEE